MKKTLNFNHLCDIIAANIHAVYNVFNVSFVCNSKLCYSNCFIHGGDNRSALNVYYNADYKPHYKCRTHGCEYHFNNSMIGLVRGALSHLKYGWEKPGDREASLTEAIEFVYKMCDTTIKRSVKRKMSYETFVSTLPIGVYSRQHFISSVSIPADYFIRRGFRRETLIRHDVGTCMRPGRQMSGRAVVPIYDHLGDKIVGFTGRIINEQCTKCGFYHIPGKCFPVRKWKNSKNLPKEKLLYNYSNAKPYIKKTNTAILVESPGNLWRLEEAGIFNVVALLGSSLSNTQKYLLQKAGAKNIITIMDNDQAGKMASYKIMRSCMSEYNIKNIEIEKNDIACMSVSEVTSQIKPIVLDWSV